MAPLLELADSRGIPVLEDCAQAAGALYRGRMVGSFGAAGAFSFYPTKIIGCYGDGGLVVTSREPLAEKLRRLRFYGIKEGYHAEEEGYNSRLDEVQAALLSYRLGQVEEEVARRREIAALYDQGLSGVGDLVLPAVKEGRRHQFYLYTVRTGQRAELMAHLAQQGVETRINYPAPIHLMRGYGFLGHGPGALPVTERLAGEILSLPIYPGLTDAEAGRVVAAIRGFFRGSRR
jgi:dTDP-4-amino-4,6-dideoxygalactose transaminase